MRLALALALLLVTGCGISVDECKKLCSPYAVASYDSFGSGSCRCDNTVKEVYPERVN